MISFPQSKINLGLHVLRRRSDGFHDIQTVFYPLTWCDCLEIIEDGAGAEGAITIGQSGAAVAGDLKDNLVYRAWQELRKFRGLPAVKVHLHKNIPMGAGLGGGSSDAAALVLLADKKFSLGLTDAEKTAIVSPLGSDCAFFLHSKPVFAEGKGDVFSEVSVDLSAYYLLAVYPDVHSNTAEAYSGTTPAIPSQDLRGVITRPLREWKLHLRNDFENSIFKKYPQVKELKERLYSEGAIYASMSGSGSAVYAIFDTKPPAGATGLYRHHLVEPRI